MIYLIIDFLMSAPHRTVDFHMNASVGALIITIREWHEVDVHDHARTACKMQSFAIPFDQLRDNDEAVKLALIEMAREFDDE